LNINKSPESKNAAGVFFRRKTPRRPPDNLTIATPFYAKYAERVFYGMGLAVGRVGGGSCWWVGVLVGRCVVGVVVVVVWCGCGVLRALGWCVLLRRLAFAHGDYNYQCSVAIVVRHEPLSQEHTIY